MNNDPMWCVNNYCDEDGYEIRCKYTQQSCKYYCYSEASKKCDIFKTCNDTINTRMKVTEQTYALLDEWSPICPKCGWIVKEHGDQCLKCGQLLSW